MHTALLSIRVILAGTFAPASLAKLADLRGSRDAVAGFGVPAWLARPFGTLLPIAELAVAVALLPAGSARYGAVGAAVLLALFVGAIARSIARGDSPDCHCFGQLHSEPAGWRALVRNLVLGAGAVFVAAVGWNSEGPSAVRWIGQLRGAGLVAFVGSVLLALLAALTARGLLALLRQNGRLLLRIDELEERLDAGGAAPAARPHIGLPLGSDAPAFTLFGLYGESVTLDSLIAAERPVLLLFTDPNCGPCNALMPQISTWQREHAAELTIAVLTRGSAEDNRSKVREHGIAGVWLDDGLHIYNAYQGNGTPGAVLLDAAGRIASPIVAGTDAIAALVGETIDGGGIPGVPGSLVPGVPVVPGPLVPVVHALPPVPAPAVPPVGAPAPAIELTDLAGKPLGLIDSERDTLVLFWNPGCGFCQRMLDELKALEQSPPAGAPRLLLVSTGSVTDNQALGLSSPIALDRAFATGTAFGTSGTPSAILIDRDGKVASTLAIGAPAVMALMAAAAEPVPD